VCSGRLLMVLRAAKINLMRGACWDPCSSGSRYDRREQQPLALLDWTSLSQA
jgi:hypothetical protein